MTNLDKSVVDFLRNVVKGLEATGNPLQHVYVHTSEMLHAASGDSGTVSLHLQLRRCMMMPFLPSLLPSGILAMVQSTTACTWGPPKRPSGRTTPGKCQNHKRAVCCLRLKGALGLTAKGVLLFDRAGTSGPTSTTIWRCGQEDQSSSSVQQF